MDDPITWQCPLCGEVYAPDGETPEGTGFGAAFTLVSVSGGLAPEIAARGWGRARTGPVPVCRNCLGRPIRDLLDCMMTPP